MWKSLLSIPLLFLVGACSSSGDGGSSDSSTYSISGTLDAGATTASVNFVDNDLQAFGMDFGLRARTACDDGQYYSVYCLSFTSPPVAAEGDVSCSGTSGSFTVDGLPLGEPIYCVVRRYDDATTTEGTNVGAIEIPTANLNGSTDTIVGEGDLTMNVTMSGDGEITATVTGDTGSSSSDAVDAFFSPATANGDWSLSCDADGGDDFSAGACKCFLGEASYGAAGYSNQDDCLGDSNGPGAAITGSVSLDIDMYVYPVTTSGPVPTDGGTIPSGTDLKAISIWADGAKTGSEGVTDLGGLLSWGTTPLDPTSAVGWSTGATNVEDGTPSTQSITIQALPFGGAASVTDMDHEDWVLWAQATAATGNGSFNCNWGPTSHAETNDTDLENNVECINQVLEALADESVGATVPRIRLQPYCDQSGCAISSDGNDIGDPSIYDANAFQKVRVEFEDWGLDYPNTWADGDNYMDGQAEDANAGADGIGVSPKSRFVFEPLEIFSNGAGFRQGHSGERHYECLTAGGEVNNAACSNGSNYYELICYTTEELAIKFIGSSSPFSVIFDSLESVVSARLVEHGGGGANEISPTGTNEIDMCETASGVSGFTFFATGTH